MNVRPFLCGTQSADWDAYNCIRCAKGGVDPRAITCDICHALTVAYFGDGTVSADIAERMNCQQGEYNWRCGEFAPMDSAEQAAHD